MILTSRIEAELEQLGTLTQNYDGSWTLSVSSDYDSTDDQAALKEARAILGDDYEVEWSGSGNTDASGDSTDDLSIMLRATPETTCQICGHRCNGDGPADGDTPCGADHVGDGATRVREIETHQNDPRRPINGKHHSGYVCGACCTYDE